MKLHQMGEYLLQVVRDRLAQKEHLSEKEVLELLRETEHVLRELLARDVVTEDRESD